MCIRDRHKKVISPTEGQYTKAMFVAPTKDGYIGTILTDEETLTAHNYQGRGEACVLTPDGNKITIGDYDRYWVEGDVSYEDSVRMRNQKELFALNNTLYYITRATDSNAALYREVEINNGTVSIDNIKVTASHGNSDGYERYDLHYGITGRNWPVFHSELGRMELSGNGEICVFDPTCDTIIHYPTPAHYPSLAEFCDNMAYVMEGYDTVAIGNNPGYVYYSSLPTRIWACDRNKTEAEPLDIDWSGVAASDKDVRDYSELHWRYWGGEYMFLATATLNDNRKVRYAISTIGENRGKARIFRGGESMMLSVVTLK